jgi:hypothetical protein
MEQRPSACPLDGPDLCGLTVTVQDGKVAQIPPHVADLGGQAAFNDARVQVAKR